MLIFFGIDEALWQSNEWMVWKKTGERDLKQNTRGRIASHLPSCYYVYSIQGRTSDKREFTSRPDVYFRFDSSWQLTAVCYDNSLFGGVLRMEFEFIPYSSTDNDVFKSGKEEGKGSQSLLSSVFYPYCAFFIS